MDIHPPFLMVFVEFFLHSHGGKNVPFIDDFPMSRGHRLGLVTETLGSQRCHRCQRSAGDQQITKFTNLYVNDQVCLVRWVLMVCIYI